MKISNNTFGLSNFDEASFLITLKNIESDNIIKYYDSYYFVEGNGLEKVEIIAIKMDLAKTDLETKI